MNFETMFIDLDDTVYPPSSGIWEAVGIRMVQYMVEKCSIPAESANAERERLFHTHGTTMRGLVAEYGINDEDFLTYVHDIPIDLYLSSDPDLRHTLLQYPQRKVVFTNANIGHAHRVLTALGILDLFDLIIDIQSIKPFCKPQSEAFRIALDLAEIKDPCSCVMIDDAARNLITAHEFGLYTIQVGQKKILAPIDAVISSLDKLPSVLPTNSRSEKYV